MNHQTKFFISLLIVCILHLIAAKLLMKIGLKCPLRLAADSLAQSVICFSLASEIDNNEVHVSEIDSQLKTSPLEQERRSARSSTEVDNTHYDFQQLIEENNTVLDATRITQQKPEKILQESIQIDPQIAKSKNTTQYKNHTNQSQKVHSSTTLTPQNKSGNLTSMSFQEAVLISSVRPRYPHQARLDGAEGTVYLKVLISTTGKITDSKIIRSSGREDLDRAAITTVREKWRFKPATLSGKPVESEKTILIEFRLQ